MDNIINHKLNLSSFQKAYTEGIYSDTPANRKLGRVGMTYTAYAEKVKKQKSEDSIKEAEITNDNGDSNKLPFEKKSEYYRKKNFGNFKVGDTIYLEKNHKLPAGNYRIDFIGLNNPNFANPLEVIRVSDNNGNSAQFTKDYIIGYEPFEGFKIMDLNYSLQQGINGGSEKSLDIK